ncbi:hypothetical protein V496_09301, partial [Pseudogymnoascus sp. VKM F-4515 (FW-2607)]
DGRDLFRERDIILEPALGLRTTLVNPISCSPRVRQTCPAYEAGRNLCAGYARENHDGTYSSEGREHVLWTKDPANGANVKVFGLMLRSMIIESIRSVGYCRL